MTTRWRLAILLGCVVVALLTAWYAGSRFTPAVSAPPPGSVRLGPDPGEAVPDYLARLPAELPPPGPPVLALVQFAAGRPAATIAGDVVTVVFRAPLPRVQTALRFEALEPGVPLATAVDTAADRARLAAGADGARLTGRPRDVAAAEAAALADPGCPCAVALVVRADRAGLEALAALPGVRAVQAAPVGVTAPELALAPLLPEQTDSADPPPDDGTVPPS